MLSSTKLLSNKLAIKHRAKQLGCIVIAIRNNYVLCQHVRRGSYVVWRVNYSEELASDAIFTAGNFDLSREQGEYSLRARAGY